MNKPTKALHDILSVALVSATIGLAACAHDTTAPSASRPTIGDASKALSGAIDQTYTWTVDPSKDSPQLAFGASYLVIPANSICALASSSYGPSYWTTPCVPETQPVTITATVHNSQTSNPSIDFEPALRYNPAVALPTLLFSVTDAATLSNMTAVKYCANALLASSCVDESLSDAALTTTVNVANNTVWRHIRHFSGYFVSE